MYGRIAITGAAGAIGGALAREMRRAWPACELALIDRDAPTALAAELGPATAHAFDLREVDKIPAFIDAIGELDGLVNCAGVMKVQHLSTWNWTDARDLITIDLLAPLRLQDLACRGMV
ncbi:MAG TPA: SDR family NAD(P)-dependent oxidoreductase, partial [Kofleriaceae bacterium]